MVMATIMAGYSGAKAAIDILEGYFSLKSESEKNQAIVAIQRRVLETQRALIGAEQEYTASLKKIDVLEAEIVRMKDWSTEKQRYELKRYTPGTLAYTLKPAMAGSEPPHHLCTYCYDRGIRSRLQASVQISMGRRMFLSFL
jgi:hypothetical protein